MKKLNLISFVFIILSFLVACGDDSTSPEDTFIDDNYAAADLSNGGLMYDKWWKVTGGTEPATDHPLWSTQSLNTRSGSTTWRCKECHGWDKQGKDGAYNTSNSHYTGFVGVYASRLKDKQIVFDALKNSTGNHDFSSVLTDLQILDMTKLIVDGLINMGNHIDLMTKAANGNATNGSTLYDANCSSCHGADGTTINLGHGDEQEFIGAIANDNPWETLHKIRFGHPGSSMPSMVKVGLSTADQVDILSFAQTLP